jgi:hypothetical protein
MALFPGRSPVPSQAERLAIESNAGVILSLTPENVADLQAFYRLEDTGGRWRPRGLAKLVETLPDVVTACTRKADRRGPDGSAVVRMPDSFPEPEGWKGLVARTEDYGPDPWPDTAPEWGDLHRDQQLGLLRSLRKDGLWPKGYAESLPPLPPGTFPGR